MKKNKITFILTELMLIVLAAFFIIRIFSDNESMKRVAVIVEDSGDKRWDALLNGLKQSAENNNLHLIICNTDLIESIEDEEELINEQLQNNVDAFVICPAPGKETKTMLNRLQGERPFIPPPPPPPPAAPPPAPPAADNRPPPSTPEETPQ